MYTGKIQLDYATVIPLVSLADKYNVRDLLRLGLEYMARNVSTAAKKHQIVTWYQFSTAAGHQKLAELTGNFIKWNFINNLQFFLIFGCITSSTISITLINVVQHCSE